MTVEIDAIDLPGSQCGPDFDGVWYEHVRVGIAKGRETEDLVSGGARSATWSFDVSVRLGDDGVFDFGGPYVSGPRGQRCLWLRWLRKDVDGNDVLFRAAKFRLYEMDKAMVDAALQPGRRLVGRVGLTDDNGWPRCATVRPPDVSWSVRANG